MRFDLIGANRMSLRVCLNLFIIILLSNTAYISVAHGIWNQNQNQNQNLPCLSMDATPFLNSFFFFSSLLIVAATTAAIDTINTSQSIADGDTIVSSEGTFIMGFFSPGASKNRYFGVWYNKISVKTVVWVANRNSPLTDSSGVLRLTDQGILVILKENGTVIWSSNSTSSATNPVAQLLDSGNIVVREKSETDLEKFLWQSFDNFCDTLLPGMKLGIDRITGLDRYMSSWLTPDDPAQGNFTYGFDPEGFPELIERENSVIKRYRAGSWNGLSFSGAPHLKPNPIYTFGFVFNDKELYYKYKLVNDSVISRFVINPNGAIERFTWIDRTQGWDLYLTTEIDNCDRYAFCGAYGSCNINNSPVCECLDGFVPKSAKEWELMDWSSGCVRRTPLNCSGDGFQKYSGVKLPETRKVWFNDTMDLVDCKKMCSNNCSCTAYARMLITNGGSGCFLWFGDLIDMRQIYQSGEDIYIRMAASEIKLMVTAKSHNRNQMSALLISFTSIGLLLLVVIILFHWRKKRQRAEKLKKDLELPLFDLSSIARATNNFSVCNKLGEGGFGPVYKGTLNDGFEIAVKRLSKSSCQGPEEFKNEVMHIAKLQHRNLVKLLGCCIQADEKMLIYEFMPNKSLDFFIFDQARSSLLDWSKRYDIINGIARGLLYLHQDSRLRIIHRDLKVSNILLDNEMNPKISDFGLARSFGGNESTVKTKNVVGTYGYMSPEYVIDGVYSIKSDIFSFGVMVLEIVVGKRNRGFYDSENHLNLLGHAWSLHREDRAIELIADEMRDSCNIDKALRSIHIGLLCVQRSPDDRPTMSSVAFMLSSGESLPEPKQPGFFHERDVSESSSLSNQRHYSSAQGITMTLMEPR